jgi:hypothetical protein
VLLVAVASYDIIRRRVRKGLKAGEGGGVGRGGRRG